MNKPYRIVRQDYCPECKEERILECYDRNNRPIAFNRVIDLLQQGKIVNLDSTELSHLKCKKCGKKFALSWVYNRHIPSVKI